MTLTIGGDGSGLPVDSYVTLDEANILLTNNYSSTSEILLKWNTLQAADQEVMLRTSRRDIDNLKFDGRRAVIGQRVEFPRVLDYTAGIVSRIFISPFIDNGLIDGDYSNDGGLSMAKEAQVENAIWHCFLDDAVNKQVGVNIKGLTSKKAGPIGETYSQNNKYNRDALRGIYTDKVYSILTPWLDEARGSI